MTEHQLARSLAAQSHSIFMILAPEVGDHGVIIREGCETCLQNAFTDLFMNDLGFKNLVNAAGQEANRKQGFTKEVVKKAADIAAGARVDFEFKKPDLLSPLETLRYLKNLYEEQHRQLTNAPNADRNSGNYWQRMSTLSAITNYLQNAVNSADVLRDLIQEANDKK